MSVYKLITNLFITSQSVGRDILALRNHIVPVFKSMVAFKGRPSAVNYKTLVLTVKNTEASRSPTENMSPLLLRWICGHRDKLSGLISDLKM